jgi:hypothetical protein
LGWDGRLAFCLEGDHQKPDDINSLADTRYVLALTSIKQIKLDTARASVEAGAFLGFFESCSWPVVAAQAERATLRRLQHDPINIGAQLRRRWS